jgi:predicted dinucleotide-binding enzyme
MKIGVLGTGMVGQAIATKLVELGHEVTMGSRRAGNENAVAWAKDAGEAAAEGSFAEAAGHGELVVNCTAGVASLEALEAAGKENLSGKTLIDIANPLDASQGFPPTLAFCNDESLGERIQAAFPDARVVKTLNTMNCQVMVEPTRVPGEHAVFMSGDDDGAKREVGDLLGSFGWPVGRIIDLGGIETARGTEMYLPLWLRLYSRLETGDFNIGVLRDLTGRQIGLLPDPGAVVARNESGRLLDLSETHGQASGTTAFRPEQQRQLIEGSVAAMLLSRESSHPV